MHDFLVIGLLVALIVLAVLNLLQSTRNLKMSETADQELSDLNAAAATLATAVALASANFTDLANKLQRALDAASQQGFTADQLASFASVKFEMAAEAASLTAAAQAADPVAVTVTAAPEPVPVVVSAAPEPVPVTVSAAPEPVVVTTTASTGA